VRVYHYLEAKWALDDIRRRRLKLSKIDDMNDPYEWACVRSSNERSESLLKTTRKGIAEDLGVLCFSLSWSNILMWSHYGDRHKGICLGFEIPDNAKKYRKIKYMEKVVCAPDLDSLSKIKQKPYFAWLYWGKYKGWSYEKEIRVHADRQRALDEETGHYFVNFDEDLKLREVIAGARFPFSRKPIDDALEGHPNVIIAKAATSEHKFELILDNDGFKSSA
jgi:hypothetical protein